MLLLLGVTPWGVTKAVLAALLIFGGVVVIYTRVSEWLAVGVVAAWLLYRRLTTPRRRSRTGELARVEREPQRRPR